MNVLVLNHSDLGKTSGVLALDVCTVLQEAGHNVEVVTNLPSTHKEEDIKVRSLMSKLDYWCYRIEKHVSSRLATIRSLFGKKRVTNSRYAVHVRDLTEPNEVTRKIIKSIKQLFSRIVTA